MLDPESITRLARKLAELYEGVEYALLMAVARQLRRGLKSEEWAAERLAEAGIVERKARRLVARLQRSREREVLAMVAAAHGAGAAAAVSVLTRAPVKGAITATLARVDSEAASRVLANALSGRLAETDLRILRSAEDIYSGVITQTGSIIRGAAREATGRATARGLAGEFTRRGAAQAALNLFADRGVTGFVDAAGKRWSLASYTEMATRTAAHHASRQGKIDEVRARGRDLVVVSGSPAACELCAPWEGKVLSLDGATPGYPTLDEAEGAGLFHPSCGHSADPYIEGLTDTSGIQHGDPELYEARQEQRGIERSIRQWKTRQAVALDDKAAARAQGKVREWQGKLREHVAANDLKRLRYREQTTKAI